MNEIKTDVSSIQTAKTADDAGKVTGDDLMKTGIMAIIVAATAGLTFLDKVDGHSFILLASTAIGGTVGATVPHIRNK